MRPRQACLGIKAAASSAAEAVLGFNEAEASLPRNPGVRLPRPRVWTYASMRPRQACLGIPATRDAVRGAFACFNEAEASLPRNPGQPL